MNMPAILVGGLAAVGYLASAAVFEVAALPAAAQEIQPAEDQKQLDQADGMMPDIVAGMNRVVPCSSNSVEKLCDPFRLNCGGLAP